MSPWLLSPVPGKKHWCSCWCLRASWLCQDPRQPLSAASPPTQGNKDWWSQAHLPCCPKMLPTSQGWWHWGPGLPSDRTPLAYPLSHMQQGGAQGFLQSRPGLCWVCCVLCFCIHFLRHWRDASFSLPEVVRAKTGSWASGRGREKAQDKRPHVPSGYTETRQSSQRRGAYSILLCDLCASIFSDGPRCLWPRPYHPSPESQPQQNF